MDQFWGGAMEERARPNPPSISRSLPCFYGSCEHGPECRRHGLRGLAVFYGIHEETAVKAWVAERLEDHDASAPGGGEVRLE